MPLRRLGGKLRSADAHAPALILPELLGRMQMADRARHGAEIKSREPFRNIGVIERLLADRVEDLFRERRHLDIVPGLPWLIGLAIDVIVELGAVGVGICDALVIFAWNSLRNGGVD